VRDGDGCGQRGHEDSRDIMTEAANSDAEGL
jgi:hypothetical protein